jgi:hypothetical protein
MPSPGASSLLGANGGGFGRGKIVFIVYYNYKNLSRSFRHRWGAGWDGLQQAPLDDVFYLWNASSIGDRSHCWERWAMFFIDIYIYMSKYNIDMPIPPFLVPRGGREWVDGIKSVQMM